MPKLVTSKSLAGPSEICMLMPIKPGFTDALATQTYEGRLASFSKLFSDLRAVSRESRLNRPFSDIVDRLETILGVTISIVDGKLLLAVHFDRPWEPYIRMVWDELGHIFDLILCNCDGYVDAHRNNLGYEAFAGWIRKYQVDTATYYMHGNHTVDDVIYLDRLEQHVRAGLTDPATLARLKVETPEAEAERVRAGLNEAGYLDYIKQGVQAVAAFHALSYLYPKGSPDHDYLLRAARAVLPENEFPKRAEWKLTRANGKALKTLQTVFFTELDWFENYSESRSREPAADERLPFDPENIQAGIATGYGANIGLLALVQIEDAATARRFLDAFKQEVSWGDVSSEDRPDCIFRNIGFTAAGLVRLGLPQSEQDKLPPAFREGMAARAGLIGDLRYNHPDHWTLPPRNWPLAGKSTKAGPTQSVNVESVDLIIQLRCLVPSAQNRVVADPALVEDLERIAETAAGGLRVLSVQPMYAQGEPGATLEHFGFRDGISNPVPDTSKSDGRDVIPVGDIFLGQPNSRGDRHPAKWSEPLFKDGTFQVIRKLSQDVAGLNTVVTANISGRSKLPRAELRAKRDELLAKLMGRTKAGVPLVEKPGPVDRNDFDFDKDPDGERCPHFSHIRRANPRDDRAFIPRILRRGMSYGAPYRQGEKGEVDRGLVFQAFNASLAEQFEIVQRWLSGGNRTAPYSRLADPFLGVPEAGRPRQYRLADGALVDLGEKPYVRLQWGLYLFVPSRVGLAIIASPGVDPAADDGNRAGAATIARLRALEAEDRDAAFVGWKRLLEENESLDDEQHRAVWQAVREQHKGALETPFGVLVGSAGLVDRVLTESADFSVVAYQERLSHCLGVNYLGMDPPEHDERAARVNEVFNSVTVEQGFDAALPRAAGLLKGLGEVGGQATIPMPKYVDLALAEISKYWFGVPDAPTLLELMGGKAPDPEALIQAGGEPPAGAQTSHCPMHVISSSRFVFQPQPSAAVDAAASREGERLRAAMDAFVAPFLEKKKSLAKKKRPPKWPSPLAKDIFQALKKDELEEDFANVLLGGLLGYLPTVQGNFLISTRDWLREQDFWRVQNAYLTARRAGMSPREAALAEIEPRLARTMARRPIPAMIHRRATRDLMLGDVALKSGQLVVVGLVSAAAEKGFEDTSPVFGGDYYGSPKPTHACPGRKLGMGTLLALIAALFELPGSLRSSPSTSALLFDPPD